MSSPAEVLKPPRLQSGDTVALVAPAGGYDVPKYQRALEHFAETTLDAHPYTDVEAKPFGIYSADDDERAKALNQAFSNPLNRAVLGIRGGYGCSRIVEKIDLAAIRRDPKIFIGFSDLTVLHLLVQKELNMVSFHGPMLLSGFADDEREGIQAFKDFFLRHQPAMICATEQTKYLSKPHARVTGIIKGGNLCMLAHSIGTGFEVTTKGSILFIEDVGEEERRIDRNLEQLRQAGKLSRVRGVVVGIFLDGNNKPMAGERVARMVAEKVAPHVPIMYDFPISHGRENRYLPLNVRAAITPNSCNITILESCFSER